MIFIVPRARRSVQYAFSHTYSSHIIRDSYARAFPYTRTLPSQLVNINLDTLARDTYTRIRKYNIKKKCKTTFGGDIHSYTVYARADKLFKSDEILPVGINKQCDVYDIHACVCARAGPEIDFKHV